MRFQVASVQFRPDKPFIEKNFLRIGELTQQAVSEGADLVVFPEAATTGYFLEGGVRDHALTISDLVERVSRISVSRPVDLAIGFYELKDALLYNSLAYLECTPNGARLVHVHQKFFLPTYGVFDEERFVCAGSEIRAFDTRFGRFALLVCEDVWHTIAPILCAVQGAEVLITASASPVRGLQGDQPSNLERYESMFVNISQEHGVYCVSSQLAGFEGGKGFPGGGLVVNPQGEVIAKSPTYEEHILISEIDLSRVKMAREAIPLVADLKTRWSEIVEIARKVTQ